VPKLIIRQVVGSNPTRPTGSSSGDALFEIDNCGFCPWDCLWTSVHVGLMAPVEEPGRWRGRIRQRCSSLRIRWFAGEDPVDQRDKTCGAPGAWRHHTPGAVADWGNGLVKTNTTPRGCGSSCAASDRIPGRSSARSKNVTATAVPSFARLERSGALRRVAPGYYAVVPDDRVGLVWLPELRRSR
jgi:hypothetical protein